MQRTRPPFRADHVGSLLRPPELREARRQWGLGEIDAAALETVEDRAIADAVALQEQAGLKSATDGEYRRAFWHYDFLWGLEGISRVETDQAVAFKGTHLPPVEPRVTGKLGGADHPMVRHFAYLKRVATRSTPKVTIPSPSALHYRGGANWISTDVYHERDEVFADLGRAYREAVAGFADAGCTYLQLDEVYLAYLCDPEQRAAVRERGMDPETLPQDYARLINSAIAGRPPTMTITMHLCRGNFKSSFIASGGYEPVAELLFNFIEADAYFMEYDTERAGGFEPLRFVPADKQVVLGLVTSKTGVLEHKDILKRRIDEAAAYCPLEQLCLSPQCGFASTEEGNTLSYDEQRRKLELVVEVAREVWGDT